MYPYIRLLKEAMMARKAPRLGLFDPHIGSHLCWPVDIDPWGELNNGRTLTLFDLGRVPLGIRTGLHEVVRKQRWGMAIVGNSTRYRRRVRVFDRVEMRSRCLGWDARFLYIDQTMWRDGECTSQMLARSAFTSAQGIVAPDRVIAAMGLTLQSPPLPDWAQAWIEADATRPWPPLG